MSPYIATVVGIGLAASALAVANRQLSKRAERRNPPRRFFKTGGLRLHYWEVGQGRPLVLLHGNGSMIQDFESSGLIEQASKKYRVIVFDRPGFGHSPRPHATVWTAERQAELIALALTRLGVSNATLFGHSWGASVAVALGLKYPRRIKGLVLVSGYYYPTARVDALISATPRLPLVGPVISHTVAPVLGRAMWPRLTKRIFAPAAVPAKFTRGFPKEMALRPSQLRASAEESALLIPTAAAFRQRYRELQMPVVIAAGADDQFIETDRQSARLYRELPHSTFHRIRGSGHMVHHTATSEILGAIDELVSRSNFMPELRDVG